MAYSNKAHAERRARLEAERAERRRLEAEEAARRSKKRKSQKTMAKWYLTGGIRIGGVAVYGGKYYAGCNTANLVEPRLSEPSLLNPAAPEGVAESSEGMSPLGAYPAYEALSPQQRRGYVEFLASDRKTTDDIGFVFLYLAGLERRLLVDAAKPGEVSDEEKKTLINELLRLIDDFGEQSRSICHYIGMLLLYDGTVFDLLEQDEIEELYGYGPDGDPRRMKLRERSDNADALNYMLVSRLAERKWDIPVTEKCEAAKGRLLRAPNAPMLNIDEAALYDRDFDALFLERAHHLDPRNEKNTSPRRVSEPARPRYYPASLSLRKNKIFNITGSVCQDPEDLGVPLRRYADIALGCFKDLERCQAVVSSSSMRDIGEVAFDAIAAISPARCALTEHLAGKDGATRVRISLIKEDLRRRFGYSLQYTSKGTLSSISQQVIAMTAASLGWQAILPETVEGLPSAYWRVREDSKVIFFKRGVAHNKNNGRRCMGPVFGRDESTPNLVLPGNWNDAAALAYIFAWFITRCPESLSDSDLVNFTSDLMPDWGNDLFQRHKRVTLFFSIMYATIQFELSTHGIKSCLDAVPFDKVKELLFSLVNDKFGNNIPTDVMEALEDVYKKSGNDKAMVLYDYHAGSYHVAHDSGLMGFSIDEERLASTIEDTSSVHTILNEAMDTDTEVGEGFTFDVGDAGVSVNADDDGDAAEEKNPAAQAPAEDPSEMLAMAESAFAGSDEMPTQELLSSIMEQVGLATSAEAMTWIAHLNELLGEEKVEIDGADAYLN